MHILELEKSRVTCNCGLYQNNSQTVDVEQVAIKHAKETFPSQLRDMRVTPHRVIRDPFTPVQDSLF
jgi:hypothetical protein